MAHIASQGELVACRVLLDLHSTGFSTLGGSTDFVLVLALWNDSGTGPTYSIAY